MRVIPMTLLISLFPPRIPPQKPGFSDDKTHRNPYKAASGPFPHGKHRRTQGGRWYAKSGGHHEDHPLRKQFPDGGQGYAPGEEARPGDEEVGSKTVRGPFSRFSTHARRPDHRGPGPGGHALAPLQSSQP